MHLNLKNESSKYSRGEGGKLRQGFSREDFSRELFSFSKALND